MDEIWKALCSVHIKANPNASRRRTDQNYAKDLQISQAEDRWRTFYRAIDALELGCGYQPFPELEALCKKALAYDEWKFLQILADEPAMMDIVVILRCVDNRTMLHWIEAGMLSNVNVLFECLRVILRDGSLPEEAQNTVAEGLLRLCDISPERFQYILRTGVLFRNGGIGIVRALVPRLTVEGWSRLSACVTFEGMDERHFRFWNACAQGQDWQAIGIRTEPILRAWNRALERSVADRAVWKSLYNEVSNLLIGILLNQVGTPGSCEQAMEQIAAQTEDDMYRWYEGALQQRSTLLAGLSQLEHLRFVWLNFEEGAPAPSAELCQRVLNLISQWKYLWDPSSGRGICGEIGQLEMWLHKCLLVEN